MIHQKISIIAAISLYDRGLGKDNQLLWKIPNDLKRFKELTSGHVIIMGRKTFESIGRPLPNRTNIIITRDESYQKDGCSSAHSLDEALAKAHTYEKEEIFIVGGGEIYTQALPLSHTLYLTLVDDQKDADTFFPDYAEFQKKVFEEKHQEGEPPYIFVNLER